MNKMEAVPNPEAQEKIERIYRLLLRQPYFYDLKEVFGKGIHPDEDVFRKTTDAVADDWEFARRSNDLYFQDQLRFDFLDKSPKGVVLGPENLRGEVVRYNATRKIAAALAQVPERVFVPTREVIFRIQDLIKRRVLEGIKVFDASTRFEAAIALAKLGAYVEYWTPKHKTRDFREARGKLGNDRINIFRMQGELKEEILRLIRHKGDNLILLNEKAIADYYIFQKQAREEALAKKNPEKKNSHKKNGNQDERPYREIRKAISRLEFAKEFQCVDDFRAEVHFTQCPPTSRAFVLKKA